MTEIESALGKTTTGDDEFRTPQSGRVLTVEDRSEDFMDNKATFDHNAAYRRSATQRQGEASEFTRKRISKQDLEELEEIRKERLSFKDRISPEARQRIEFLMELGRINDSVEVDGIKFSFQSLKSKEQEDVFDQVAKHDKISAVKMQYEIRTYTLACALTHIQDKPFSAVIESDLIDDKVQVIRSLDENLLDHLYKWYQANIIKVGQDKYVVKDQNDLKEVVEDIKK